MKSPNACPFCGVKVDLDPREVHNIGTQVECVNCGTCGPFKKTMEEAVAAFDKIPSIAAHAADRSAFEAASKVAMEEIAALTEKVKALEESLAHRLDEGLNALDRVKQLESENRLFEKQHLVEMRRADTATARVAALEAFGHKVEAVMDSITGLQGFNWSEHAYPLRAALTEAGFPGKGYDLARENLGTLIDRCNAAESKAAALEAKTVAAEALVDWPRAILLALGEVDHHEGDICLKFAARVKAIALDEHDEDEEFRS